MDVTYRCRLCRTEFPVRVPGYKTDPEWDEKLPPLPRRRCPSCGAASAPAAWLDERIGQTWGADEEFFQYWSSCRNASVCSRLDAYQGDCESGQLMPKCLQTVHQHMQSLLQCLPAGKRTASRQVKRKGSNNADPESGS